MIPKCFLVLFLSLQFFVGLAAGETLERVVIQTTAGEILVELYPDKAPLTVNNFLAYVDTKAYDNCHFFRVVRMDNQLADKIKIEVIQGGDLKAELSRPAIVLETTAKTGVKHVDGAISMARGAPNSAQASFFICINDQPELDFGGQRNTDGQGFAAFGRVCQGMDVVRAIQQMPVKGQSLQQPVTILNIRRIVEAEDGHSK